MACLYSVNFPNGKMYIGITRNTAAFRFSEHVAGSLTPEYAIHHAINKYGALYAVVRTMVISNCWEYLKRLEKAAIASFNSKVPNGYNMTDGGDGVIGLSIEARAKMSEAKKGKKLSPSHVEAVRRSLRGRRHTEDTKVKMAAAKIGKKRAPFSAEHRQNMSIAVKTAMAKLRMEHSNA